MASNENLRQNPQALLVEAINDLFAKYGLSRIADE